MEKLSARNITVTEFETHQLGRRLAIFVADHISSNRAFVVFLRGNLGAGKTVFVRGFLSLFGVRRVLSPTFTLVRRYGVRGGPRKKRWNVYHIDAYRLHREDRARLGLNDILTDPFSIVLIEWPANLGRMSRDVVVNIAHRKKENERCIKIDIRK